MTCVFHTYTLMEGLKHFFFFQCTLISSSFYLWSWLPSSWFVTCLFFNISFSPIMLDYVHKCFLDLDFSDAFFGWFHGRPRLWSFEFVHMALWYLFRSILMMIVRVRLRLRPACVPNAESKLYQLAGVQQQLRWDTFGVFALDVDIVIVVADIAVRSLLSCWGSSVGARQHFLLFLQYFAEFCEQIVGHSYHFRNKHSA